MRTMIAIWLVTLTGAHADGITHHISPEFEVQDGLGVTYARVGRERVVRMVSMALAAKLYPDAVPDGKITAGDVWVAGSTAPVEPMLLSSARRTLYEVLPEVTWLGADPLGSITVETDDQGAVVGRRSYATFGELRAQSGDADRYGFTGQELDASGTMHFSFRQLDPTTGRWASADPLFAEASEENIERLGESATAYDYVANNPSTAVDPTGLMLDRAPHDVVRHIAGYGDHRAVRAIAAASKNLKKALKDHLPRAILEGGAERLSLLLTGANLRAGSLFNNIRNSIHQTNVDRGKFFGSLRELESNAQTLEHGVTKYKQISSGRPELQQEFGAEYGRFEANAAHLKNEVVQTRDQLRKSTSRNVRKYVVSEE